VKRKKLQFLATAAATDKLHPSCYFRNRLNWDVHVANIFQKADMAFYY